VVSNGVRPDAAILETVGAWPGRLLLTAAVVVAIVGCLLLMRWGWVRRARRQHDIADLPAVPDLPDEQLASDVSEVDARYIGSNRAGDWLDRVVVHGLGVPSTAVVSVRGVGGAGVSGVWIGRRGAPDIFVPGDDVRGARHDRGAAGQAFEADGVLVVTWVVDQVVLELGLRVRNPAQAERLRAAIDALASVTPTIGERS
jgi:hypothetical protein